MNITFIFRAIIYFYPHFDIFEQPIEKYSESKSLSCQEQPQHISSARRYVGSLVSAYYLLSYGIYFLFWKRLLVDCSFQNLTSSPNAEA